MTENLKKSPVLVKDIPGLEVYSVEIGGKDELALYSDQKGQSLIWEGRLNFSELEKTRESLNQLVIGTQDTVTNVTIVTTDNQALEYSLSSAEERSNYKRILEDPEKIDFIRYDVISVVEDGVGVYSFTAGNPGSPLNKESSEESEIGLRTPSFQSSPEELMDWIIDHHKNSDSLKSAVTAEQLLQTINSAQ